MGNYPLSKYHFTVEWGNGSISFSEVSGLTIELTVVEHRDGSSPEQHTIKMPGLRKFSNIILKRPVRKDDHEFFDWINRIRMNVAERRDVVIKLLNEEHKPITTWIARNAWPCKYSVADLNALSNEVLIETLELAHEGLSLVP